MNETLQQFCHRILPIVQAGAEGKDIESKCLRDADDWGSHEARLFLHDYEYRVAQPKATPLPITPEMWAMIDPKYEWAILNEKGEKKLTSHKPEWKSTYLGTGWHIGIYAEDVQLPLAIDTTGIIPELSLTKRPPNASEAIRKAIADDAKATKKLMGYHDDAKNIVIDGGCDVHVTKVHTKEKSLLEQALDLAEQAEALRDRINESEQANTPIFVNGVRVGSLNQFGEVTGGSGYDPESTRKEMDRLAE